MHCDARLDAINTLDILRVRETKELVLGAGADVENRAAGLYNEGGEGGGKIVDSWPRDMLAFKPL